MEEPPDPLGNLNSAIHLMHSDEKVHTNESMGPPPLPANLAMRYGNSTPVATASTSPEEARRALEVVLSFFEQQPHGCLDLQESVTIGKLMEKLKLQTRG